MTDYLQIVSQVLGWTYMVTWCVSSVRQHSASAGRCRLLGCQLLPLLQLSQRQPRRERMLTSPRFLRFSTCARPPPASSRRSSSTIVGGA